MRMPWDGAIERRLAEASREADARVEAAIRAEQVKMTDALRGLTGMMSPIGSPPTQGKRPIYALDQPIVFTTPNSPRRKPGQLGSCDDLRRLADTWDILRTPIEHLKREVKSSPIIIQARDGRDDSDATKKRIDEARQFFSTHGGNGEFGKPRSTFETEWLEDLLVLGCYSIFRVWNRGGTLHNQICIDAATIRPRVDAYGWQDDEIRFEQWIYGTCVGHFQAQDIVYDGINARSNSPYFRSPLEWLMAPIVSGIAEDEWNRTFFTSGDAPGDDVFTLPSELSSDQIKIYADIFAEILAGDTTQRRKTRWLPSGSERLSTGTRREHDFQEFEMWILRRVWAMFGVAPSACGFAGEQYKVSQDGSNDQTTQFGAGALLAKRKEFYGDSLEQLGFGDLEINDPTAQVEETKEDADRANSLWSSGLGKLNECRKLVGWDPVPDGDKFKSETEPDPNPGDKTNDKKETETK